MSPKGLAGPARRPGPNDEPLGVVSMMNHSKHSYLMLGVIAVGVVLFLTGNVGGWLFLLWPVACIAMMVWMMWSMGGMGRSAPAPDHTHTHEDGVTHAHQ